MSASILPIEADILVVGGGIAGATVAAHAAADARVVLLEAEAQPGLHSTGRSAAVWIRNYGPPDVRALTGHARNFLTAPPAGFTEARLVEPRVALTVVPPGEEESLAAHAAAGIGIDVISPRTVRQMVPALRDGAVGAALREDGFSLDVAALHQGFLRLLRARGGQVVVEARAVEIGRAGGVWQVRTAGGARFAAPVLGDAAGAWGDAVARLAGVTPLGLVPKRRTVAIIDPAPWQVAAWPMIADLAGTWYAAPEARTRLLVSPADETPVEPHDAKPEEIDIATGIDRMQHVLDIEVRRVEHSWAGLRSFTPDGSLAFGWDARAEGFFWCVGQGGYGIQTSPAAGALVADLLARRHSALTEELAMMVDPRRFSGRAVP